MKTAIVAFVALCLGVAAGKYVLNTELPEVVPNQYIVVFNSSISHDQVAQHMITLNKKIQWASASNPDSTSVSAKVLASFHIENFRAYSAVLPEHMVLEELNSPDVDFIEQDMYVHAYQSCAQQTNAVWGLDRISERDLDIDGIYRYTSNAGSGVDAYIIDTGILTTHNEFSGGRAVWGDNFVDTNDQDCNGHGTHVAGTVGGKTYGVAKQVRLIAVKVLNCQGSGTNTGVISGIQYAAAQKKSTQRPSVANMSLGGARSSALDSAVAGAVSGGVAFIVAAGNENQDACNTSPAGSSSAVAIGATTIDDAGNTEEDQRATFSNYGTCVALFAPGELIESAWIGSNSAVNTISGTSMASPHACGAAAVYLSNNPSKTPADVKNFLVTQSTSNMIDLACRTTIGTCNSSPNRLLYSACDQ